MTLKMSSTISIPGVRNKGENKALICRMFFPFLGQVALGHEYAALRNLN